MIEFVFEKGVEQAAQDVRDAVSTIRGDLPQEIEEPIIGRFDWSDEPIVSLTLSSPSLTQAQLTALADPRHYARAAFAYWGSPRCGWWAVPSAS